MSRKIALALVASAALGALIQPAAAGEWLKDPVSGCQIWSSDDSSAGGTVTWSGACHDGKAAGRGVGVWVDKKGLAARYDGEMEGGKANGLADLHFRTDAGDHYWTYSGNFADGEPVGEATIVTDTGYRFRGELIDGIKHVRGTIVAPNGDVVRGEIKDGKVVGTALAYYEANNKETYLGEVENGKRNGNGTLLMPNNDLYVGEFRDGKTSGYGTFFADAGGEYVGHFADNQPNGPGTYVAPNGDTWQGRFVNGKPDGLVLVTKVGGEQSTETWKSGEKVQ